jgi:lysozyme
MRFLAVIIGGGLAAFAISRLAKNSGYSLFQSMPEDAAPVVAGEAPIISEGETVKPWDFIKKMEGLALSAYKDIAGIVTIGYGHVLKAGESFSVISESKADELLAMDAASADRAVAARVKVPLSDNQRAALVSLVFNIGEGNFAGSTLLRALNSGDYQAAANQFRVWNKARNPTSGRLEISTGLMNRREQERTLFLS